MDAMSGRGELEDRGLVADFYGLGEWAEYKSKRTEADGADGADSIVLGGIQDWADWADWGGQGRRSGRSGVQNPRRGRLGRTGGLVDAADATDYGILDGVDCGRRGGLGRTRWTGADGADGADGGLEGRKGRTRKLRAGVPVDWTDRLGCARPDRLASSRLRAEGIPGVLSPDADCGVIWLHTPRIHIRFFGAHIVVIFLGTHTSKAQRASTSDKFFGSLGALNIIYSMFIQMGHAIRNVVIVTYKGGLSSLVPPSPLCTSCCS